MVADDVVHKCSTRISVSTNGHTLVDTIGRARDDVVELVRHSSRTRHIGHTGGREGGREGKEGGRGRREGGRGGREGGREGGGREGGREEGGR